MVAYYKFHGESENSSSRSQIDGHALLVVQYSSSSSDTAMILVNLDTASIEILIFSLVTLDLMYAYT